MKRLILLIAVISCLANAAMAQQTGKITGIVVDSLTTAPVPGAVIEVISVKNPSIKKYVSAEVSGKIEVNNLSYGSYTMKITFLGYSTWERTIRVNKSIVNLGNLYMKEESQKIDEIVLEAKALRTSQKGDTVVYNADSFKVTKDADAESLLSKMPGITVIDGEVEAQGETVEKIFVDGKEFFGGDVTSAIKNLPAEVISKIEVYDKLSDQAEFTGIDDGEGFKAINIVTTVDKGYFGKLNAGYGFNDKYIGGGNINYFKGDQRISLIGMANNVNQQNFAMEDLMGVVSSGNGMQSRGGGYMRGMRSAGAFLMRPQDGISTVTSFGVNYNDTWGKKVEVSASYFFNKSRNENERITDRQYTGIGDDFTTYNADADTWNRNLEHRFNAKIEYNINENQSLMIRPNISFQNYHSTNSTFGINNGVSGADTSLINNVWNGTNSRSNGYRISNSIIYRIKLGKPGRTLTLDINGSTNKNDRKGLDSTLRQNLIINPVLDSLFKQRSINNSNGYSLNGNLIYTEPLTPYSQVNASYRISYSHSDADKEAYLWDRLLNQFSTQLDGDFSNIYNNDYLTHRAGLGYNYNKDKNMFVMSVSYQRSILKGDQDYPTPPRSLEKSFNNIVYFAMLEKAFSSSSTLRIRARSYTSNPSIFQLQDVVDMSNTQFVSSGNPYLKPSYTHNLFATYNKSGLEKGQTFMAMVGFNIQNNYIGDSTVRMEGAILPNGYELAQGAQYTKPVNMNGKWSVSGNVSFGTPISFLKSNVNFNLRATYNEQPSIINSERNILKGQYYSGGIVLGSNISERIDFTLSYNGGYNITKNTVQDDKDNTYISQGASFRFKWVAWAGFTLTANATYSQYHGITDKFNEQYVICNAYLGKKVFRNQRGELTVGVNDLFNQNTSFSRNITDTYIENLKNRVLGRYVSVQFTYNLRSFKGKGTQGEPDSLGGGHHGGGRPPMGPPPGGGRPF